MPPNLSTQLPPSLLLLMPLLALVLIPVLWMLLVYAVSARLRDDDPHRLKLAIALAIVAAILPGLWARDWNDLALFGAVGVMLATLTFGFVYVLPRARAAPPESAERERCDGLRESCLATVAAAFALGMVSTVANTLQFDTHSKNLMLSLPLVALMVWQSGFWLGRASLHLRRRNDDDAPLRGQAWKR